jgi:hypothetical protein
MIGVEPVEYLTLISRPFALPFETKSCLVKIEIPSEPDDFFYIKVVANTGNYTSGHSISSDCTGGELMH